MTDGSTWRVRRRALAALALAYVLLLAASHLADGPATDPPPVAAGVEAATLPAFDDDDTLAGEHVRIAFRAWGPQPGESHAIPIILLHGSPGDSSNFEALAPLLAQDRPVIAIDRPGYGHSSLDVPDFGSVAQARYVLSLMDQEGIPRAAVLGWSSGGCVAIHMADLAPQRVAAIVLLAAMGAQETEGTGSRFFERIKYGVGYVGLIGLPNLIPHFGAYDEYGPLPSMIREFWDMDLRPNDEIMRRLKTPTLILHGRHDFLIADWAAEVHHQLIPDSHLVMVDGDHFLPFRDPELVERHVSEFLAHVERGDQESLPPTIDLEPAKEPFGPAGSRTAELIRSLPWWAAMTILALSVVAAPFVATAAALMLVLAQNVDLGAALAGVMAGRAWTHLRAGRHAIGAPLSAVRSAILILVLWLAVMVPLLVAGASPESLSGWQWITLFLGTWIATHTLDVPIQLLTWQGRQRLRARATRLVRHEFWPSWLFYAFPLASGLVRSIGRGGPGVITCLNPAMGGGGGLVGEHKHDIFSAAAGAVLHHRLVPHGMPHSERARLALDFITNDQRLGGFPVILKPDRGWRGYGVRLAHGPDDVERYFNDMPRAVIIQRYHPGPHECGILWARDPHAPVTSSHGAIFSVTRKAFPAVTGDGRRTLQRLVLSHPRYRAQADTFRDRFPHLWRQVIPAGRTVRLSQSGNHCQGAMFLDGADLITPELHAAVERIIEAYTAPDGTRGGLDVVRLDVRYESDDLLRQGLAFGVVEINGASSESGNVYDPSWPILRAQRVAARYVALLVDLGAARRRAGHRGPSLARVLATWLRLTWRRPPLGVAD